MKRFFIQVTLLFTCCHLVMIVNCGNETPKQVCTPGSTQQCLCLDQKSGVQVCDDNGLKWGTCQCSNAPQKENPSKEGQTTDAGSQDSPTNPPDTKTTPESKTESPVVRETQPDKSIGPEEPQDKTPPSDRLPPQDTTSKEGSTENARPDITPETIPEPKPVVCDKDGVFRCNGATRQVCRADGSGWKWVDDQTCQHGCKNGGCSCLYDGNIVEDGKRACHPTAVRNVYFCDNGRMLQEKQCPYGCYGKGVCSKCQKDSKRCSPNGLSSQTCDKQLPNGSYDWRDTKSCPEGCIVADYCHECKKDTMDCQSGNSYKCEEVTFKFGKDYKQRKWVLFRACDPNFGCYCNSRISICGHCNTCKPGTSVKCANRTQYFDCRETSKGWVTQLRHDCPTATPRCINDKCQK